SNDGCLLLAAHDWLPRKGRCGRFGLFYAGDAGVVCWSRAGGRPEELTLDFMPFVLEAHADSTVGERPQVLDEPVVEFTSPLAGQECSNLVATDNELAPIAPDRIFGVGQGDTCRIAWVPGVLGQPHLLRGRLERERWGNHRRWFQDQLASGHVQLL